MTSEFIGREHDFEFLVGDWSVLNRRLKQRNIGSDDWEEFPATFTGQELLEGVVSVDEMRCPTKGFSGCTVRTLDRAARNWSIYWINSESGRLFQPVHGGFSNGRGEFYGDDDDNGRPVRVRFIWTQNGPNSAQWEQAFSLENGGWETNWIMQFTRTVK
jgi:hypothetical protein